MTPTDFFIDTAKLADVQDILSLHRRCFPSYVEFKPFEEITLERIHRTYVLRSKTTGLLVGFFSFVFMDEARIASLCLEPNYRGQGLGKFMILEAERLVKSQGFSALNAKTAKYRELYDKLGYKTITSYFAGGRDQFFLRKVL